MSKMLSFQYVMDINIFYIFYATFSKSWVCFTLCVTSLRTDHPSGVPCPRAAASHPLGTDSTGAVRRAVLAADGLSAGWGELLR